MNNVFYQFILLSLFLYTSCNIFSFYFFMIFFECFILYSFINNVLMYFSYFIISSVSIWCSLFLDDSKLGTLVGCRLNGRYRHKIYVVDFQFDWNHTARGSATEKVQILHCTDFSIKYKNKNLITYHKNAVICYAVSTINSFRPWWQF